MKDRLEKGRERLEDAREAIKALCEPVDPPKHIQDYIRYFCSDESANAEQIKKIGDIDVAGIRSFSFFPY